MPESSELVNLFVLRSDLDNAITALLDERDEATANGKLDVAETAQAEAEHLASILATVQHIININAGINMSLLAERIETSIAAQKAVGLSRAADMLAITLGRVMPVPVTPTPPPAGPGASPAPGGNGATPSPGGNGAVAIVAKPGPHQAIVEALIDGAREHGLAPMAVLTIVAIESDFRPDAQNPRSSAGGLFQFIDSTWVGEGGKKVPGRGGIGNGHAAAAPVETQIEIGCKFIRKNFDTLKNKLGRGPTTTALYMAHQQGLGGALKILKASRAASIESVVGHDAARLNGMAGMSVAQAIEKFERMVRVNEDEARALVTTAATAPTPVAHSPVAAPRIAERAVARALEELEVFARRDDGSIVTETQERLNSRVIEYFRRVGIAVTNGAQEPWSAAFISFVIQEAGANEGQFPFSPRHSTYIYRALENRMRNRLTESLVYFDADEIAPRVGDLVGRSRTSAVQSRKDIEKTMPGFFPSHTDLVVDVKPGRIKAIGGNLSDTIGFATLATDSEGRLTTSGFRFVLQTNF